MQFNRVTKIFAAGVLGSLLLAPAWAEKVSMEAATTNSVVGLMPQTMAPHWAKVGVDVELALDQTLTKSLLKIGQGSLDSAVVPPPLMTTCSRATGPYKAPGRQGRRTGRQRAQPVWFLCQHRTTPWSGPMAVSANWSQLKGKRVFVGPPAGAANAQIRSLDQDRFGSGRWQRLRGHQGALGVLPRKASRTASSMCSSRPWAWAHRRWSSWG